MYQGTGDSASLVCVNAIDDRMYCSLASGLSQYIAQARTSSLRVRSMLLGKPSDIFGLKL